MFEEPVELSGLTLRPISLVDLEGDPLHDYATELMDEGENYSVLEIKIPGQRKRGYLLSREWTGRIEIGFGKERVVSGFYSLPEAVAMFAERIKAGVGKAQEGGSEADSGALGVGEGLGEGGSVESAVDASAMEARRIELIEEKSNLRPNQKLGEEKEAELARLHEWAAKTPRANRHRPLREAEIEKYRGSYEETAPKKRGRPRKVVVETAAVEEAPRTRGRPKGSKNRTKVVAQTGSLDLSLPGVLPDAQIEPQPKRRGRPRKVQLSEGYRHAEELTQRALATTAAEEVIVRLTHQELKVVVAYLTSGLEFTYEAESELSGEENKIGDTLLERLRNL